MYLFCYFWNKYEENIRYSRANYMRSTISWRSTLSLIPESYGIFWVYTSTYWERITKRNIYTCTEDVSFKTQETYWDTSFLCAYHARTDEHQRMTLYHDHSPFSQECWDACWIYDWDKTKEYMIFYDGGMNKWNWYNIRFWYVSISPKPNSDVVANFISPRSWTNLISSLRTRDRYTVIILSRYQKTSIPWNKYYPNTFDLPWVGNHCK